MPHSSMKNNVMTEDGKKEDRMIQQDCDDFTCMILFSRPHHDLAEGLIWEFSIELGLS